MSFFGEIRHIARLYRWIIKEKAMAFKIDEMEVKEKLVEATKKLHLDMYNAEVQGIVNNLRDELRAIENQNAKGAVVRSRVM